MALVVMLIQGVSWGLRIYFFSYLEDDFCPFFHCAMTIQAQGQDIQVSSDGLWGLITSSYTYRFHVKSLKKDMITRLLFAIQRRGSNGPCLTVRLLLLQLLQGLYSLFFRELERNHRSSPNT
ncbi:hypothetical protein ACRALDRAFT_206525 [Sodiomyces alcalophilus JCM 7366]|uniref:uncharacterized protein n=1 Tax=Sodiomyces alcalophilus JCM 7366 TaxID=591952 RepID=UPI0039B4A665